MNHKDLIRLAKEADSEGNVELADYLDNQLIRLSGLADIYKFVKPYAAKGFGKVVNPHYNVDFKNLADDSSNLSDLTKVRPPKNKLDKFISPGTKIKQRTPERLTQIENSIKQEITYLTSADPKINAAIKKVQNGQAISPQEEKALLDVLVNQKKIATRYNDVAIEDIQAVLKGQKPSLTTKQVSTVAPAIKGAAGAAAVAGVASVGSAAVNSYNQSQTVPGELYNDGNLPQQSPGNMPGSLPENMPASGPIFPPTPQQQQSPGPQYNGPDYQMPRYQRPSNDFIVHDEAPSSNDQLFVQQRNYPQYNRQVMHADDYPTYEPIGPMQEGQEYLGGPTEQVAKTYEPIGPMQEGQEVVGGPVAQVQPTYQEPTFQEPPYPV